MQFATLVLEDFQAHESLRISFSPTITTIKGPTDKGKSAILRALRWVCLNDLAGDDFVRDGQRTTSVNVTVVTGREDSQVITRSKSVGGATNTYTLEDKEFKSFSTSVPADIAKVLEVNEINFQGQHDTPFWFSETAGEVSRRLNAVIDLSVIDTSLTFVAAAVRQANEHAQFCEGKLEETKEELRDLKPHRERVADFKKLSSKDKELEERIANVGRLSSLIGRVQDLQVKSLKQKAEEGEALFALAKQFVRIDSAHEELEDCIGEAVKLRTAATPPPDFAPVDQAHDKAFQVENLSTLLLTLLENIKVKKSAVISSCLAFEAAEKQFHKRIKGEKCPLCGNQIE